MKRNILELIQKMTLEEKAGLCSGADFWHTKAVPRLGIPSVMVSDGPYGLRKQDLSQDHLGVNDSIKAVCFPAGCATACSFDRDLLQQEGETLGNECQSEGISVILGPAVNIKRSPLCGRNFEYFSEDPYLAGQIAAAYIKGVESRNVGTSIKHFAANNEEFRRMSGSSEVDERTLREIYLTPFETAVKKAVPDTVMCSYNKINGTFSSENSWLLTQVLRKEWGFKGYVMSDWGAVNNRVEGLKAGLDLEMPASGGETDRQIVDAVKKGLLDEKILNTAVERILNIVFKFADDRREGSFDKEKDHKIAAEIAQESMVLLKNEDSILPLSEKDTSDILFVGVFADHPRFEGGGSSHINSFKVTSALEQAKSRGLHVRYVPGFDLTEKDDQLLRKEAVEAAKKAGKVVIFAGLPDSYESEGYDRSHMRMPENQNALIEAIAEVQSETIVVLHNGSPVEMPWADRVKGILESYLGGEGVGIAQINLLFGYANPCGKLAESFPLRLEDTPCYINFPGSGKKVHYTEGVFVGYRYYNKKKMKVLFPFGFGLSYTSFVYSNLKLDKKELKDTETLTVTVSITNTGSVAGKEIVELYVSDKTGTEIRPERELKNFEKVYLEPGETKTVTMELDKRSFTWYDTNIHDWYAATGEYEIQIGKSSEEICLSTPVRIISTTKNSLKVDANTVFAEINGDPSLRKTAEPVIQKIIDHMQGGQTTSQTARDAISNHMVQHMMDNMPLRSLRSFAKFTQKDLEEFISELNNVNNS